MAALCTGNYGLSQNCNDNSKEYFFVKLTDSAYRAIEDYQRNQNKYNTHATIQILGNGGLISFPSPSGNVGPQFRFSIDEIEGSFECIQQTQNQLDVLGALPYKMRIHANDDVYETTRHRMAVAEENQKNKCTREIKPNQTDIGRKVKLKNSSNRIPNIPPKRDQILTSTTSQSPLPTSTSSTSLNAVSSTQLSTGTASALNIGSTATTGNTISSSSSSSLSIGSSVTGSTSNLPIINSAYSSIISPLQTINSSSSSSNSLKNLNNVSTSSSLNSITNNNNNSSSSLKHYQNYNSTSSTTNLPGVSSASSLSSALSSAAVSGTSGIGSSYYSNNSNSGGLRATNGVIVGNNSSNNGGSRRSTSGTSLNNRNQRNGSRHMPDITKKKIRERLIHLLALKPYKKPELYTRLQNEGIREREKSLLSTILKEISIIRDNTYNLKRQIWNDVNEDWPFYTEQELQMLKRRKPQNLTPPLSSDGGSSTSGQSPTSTHNGSPPPAVKRPSLDRDRFVNYEEPTAKKQRISHFRKDNNEINSSNVTVPTKTHQEPEDNAMSISYAVLGSEAARRISPRDEVVNGHSNSNSSNSSSHHHNIPNSHHHNANITNNNISSNNKNSNNTTMNNSGNAHHKSPIPPYSHPNSNTVNNVNSNNNNNNNSSNNNNNNSRDSINCIDNSSSSQSRQSSSSPMMMMSIGTSNVVGGGIGGASSPGAVPPTRTISNNNHHQHHHHPIAISGFNERGGSAINNNSSNNINNHHGSNSSDSYNPGGPLTNNSYDFSRFTSIRSVEQRRQYKTEFENDYDEYRDLLNQIESVGKKFNVLAMQLQNAKNNDASYKVIRKKILNEYEKINRDQEHQRVKARFDYLHAKLAHIKKLVNDFDQTITAPTRAGGSGGDPLISDISNGMNSGNIDRISSPIHNGGTLHMSNGTNNSNKNGGKIRSSPIGSMSTGSNNLHHLPKQENY